jgi:3',5'-cyclic AMP phosphodiesterase CpdA
MSANRFRILLAIALVFCRLSPAQEPVRVRAIVPPATPLASEDASAGVERFSFVVYGDTRGRQDGNAVQYEHLLVVSSMLAQTRRLQTTAFPVRFVLQSGDAVVNGERPEQWNASFNPVIDLLTKNANVPYYLVPGNHDVGTATTAQAPDRQPGLRNFLAAMAALLPPEGSPRRLTGYPVFSFGYGNTFVLGLDSNLIGDEIQFAWVKAQLEGLDRTRYKHIIVFCHQNIFSSGLHGGATVEPQTIEMRNRYMPLFRANHVEIVFSGHEHLFEHWVERYTDATGAHRMDLVVSGGGGAPLYEYRQDPDTRDYVRANAANQVRLEQLAQPGAEPGSNPYHFLIVTVDGDKLNMEVFGVDWGVGYKPYRSSRLGLHDQ